MNRQAMEKVQEVINRNYRAGTLPRADWLAAIEGLHRSYAESHGMSACVCLCCREVRTNHANSVKVDVR